MSHTLQAIIYIRFDEIDTLFKYISPTPPLAHDLKPLLLLLVFILLDPLLDVVDLLLHLHPLLVLLAHEKPETYCVQSSRSSMEQQPTHEAMGGAACFHNSASWLKDAVSK